MTPGTGPGISWQKSTRSVMMTDPYQSVTTPDINIGIVKAMTYPNGTVYGVLGADITLKNLTDYISSFDIGRKGEILLVNETGTILASRNESALFSNIEDIIGREQTKFLLKTEKGILPLRLHI
jgi:methyl-accepting chemotaxis protein